MYGMYNNYQSGYNNGFMPQMPSMSQMQGGYAPTMQVTRVNGRQGAEALRMGANSSALLLDESEQYAWYVQTDGAGYKSILQLDIIPHKEAPTPDYSDLDERVRKIEEVIKNANWSNLPNDGNAAEPTYKPDAITPRP